MGISKDVLIVHCDCNNKGGGVALVVNKNHLNPKQNQNEHNFGNCCYTDK